MPRSSLARGAMLLLPAAIVAVVLLPFVALDPAEGFTFSNSPFTDEAWWLANARTFVLFGSWSTDDWNLHLVSPVYSALQAAVFSVLGVDIIAARVAVIAAVGLTCVALAFGLRARFGSGPALVAAAAYGMSPLVLYYGRLAYIEPIVALGLTLGALTLARSDGFRAARWGLVGGTCLALAIGAKPVALPLVVGMIGGLLVLEGRSSRWAGRWSVAAVVVVVVAGLAWAALVLLPQREALAVVTRILADVTLPDEPGELLYRVLSYPLSNDRALLYTLPLIVGAVGGAILAWRAWGVVPAPSRRLVACAAGWLVVGIVVLLVVPYRPNRYFLPLVPPLAMLTAAGLALWRPPVASGREPRPHFPATRRNATLIVAAAVLTLPGMLLHASWVAGGTQRLRSLQATAASSLPEGAVVEGAYAPALAFRSRAVAIVSRPDSGVNGGDLYAERGARWVVGEPFEEPAWAPRHRAAWNDRRSVLCEPWGSAELCLFEMP